MKKSFLFLSFLSIVFFLSSCGEKDNTNVLTIEGGKIQGVETATKGITAFKGIHRNP